MPTTALAWRAPQPDAMPARRWSLAARLMVPFCAILAVTVIVFGIVSYRAVRESAVLRAAERFRGVVRELSTSTGRTAAARAATLQQAATGAAVVAAIDGDPDSVALSAFLATVPGARDSSLLATQLWDAQGRRSHSQGRLEAQDSLALTAVAVAALGADSARRSPIYAAGDRFHVWTVVPTTTPGGARGVIAELRQVGSLTRAQQALRELTGAPVHLHFVGNGPWVGPTGGPVPAPFALSRRDSVVRAVHRQSGEPHYIMASTLTGTPWTIVVSQSEATILAGPRELLRRFAVAGVLLLLAGAAGAWWASRREVQPLATLQEAAAEVAGGNYALTLPLDGSREMATLAHMFNAMAFRIGESHELLARQNAALQQANEARVRFLAMMSHELRTPLNAIGGYADLLALGVRGPLSQAQALDIERIKENQGQLLRLIADILQVSRSDGTGVSIEIRRVELDGALSRLRETLAEQFARKGVGLDIRPTQAVVDADPDRLHQVLCNLCNNALSFSAPESTVRVRTVIDGDWTRIAVTDEGIGIAAGDLERIFEPFVQVDSSLTRRSGGAGLGLAIVRELTRAMGGAVDVSSRIGAGSTFTVTLRTSSAAVAAPTRETAGIAAHRMPARVS